MSIADTNGVYLLTESQLDTFEIVPESGFFGTMRLEISAISTEASNSDVAQSNSQFYEFNFAKVSDPPVLSSSSTVEGTEDNMVSQGLPLGLGASVPSGTSLEAFIAMVNANASLAAVPDAVSLFGTSSLDSSIIEIEKNSDGYFDLDLAS